MGKKGANRGRSFSSFRVRLHRQAMLKGLFPFLSGSLCAMLEFGNLLLRRWERDDHNAQRPYSERQGSPPTWVILEPSSGSLVGLVRTARTSEGIWARWFGRGCLAIFESGDEPLLCTIQRRWGLSSAWDLRDADGHAVGRIARGALQGPLGRFWITVNQANSVTEFRDRDGQLLASVDRQRGERLLSFAHQIKGDPFARMLILGSALVLPEN
jgi:hypothetical protein